MVAPAAPAHDFWLRADAFRAEAPSVTARLRFQINEATTPEPWDLRWRKVVALRSIGPSGAVTDQQAGVHPGEADGYAEVALAGAGTHIVAFESNLSTSSLPAAKFEPYVAEEGLAAIAEARRVARAKGPGRELYARRAKALVQLGPDLSATVTRPVGHTLEIVPLRHPLALAEGEAMPLQVLFQGRPLAGATVHAARLAPDPQDGVARAVTDADGKAVLAFPKQGAWKVVVVWGVPITGDKAADYQTIFASLTFGYD